MDACANSNGDLADVPESRRPTHGSRVGRRSPASAQHHCPGAVALPRGAGSPRDLLLCFQRPDPALQTPASQPPNQTRGVCCGKPASGTRRWRTGGSTTSKPATLRSGAAICGPPKSNRNGARNQTYDNMLLAKVGDTVYSYAHGRLGAIGVVIRAASPCPKPVEFGTVGDYWNNDGWLLQVAFTPSTDPYAPPTTSG